MLFRPAGPDVDPDAHMTRWLVLEVRKSKNTDLVTRHLVGRVDGAGRVSSAIQEFDPKTRTAITQSGRRYHLQGEPSANMDALYVWGAWANGYGVTEWVDVTEEYETKEG